MAARKKQKSASKKPTGKVRAVKTAKKKTGGSSSKKAKTRPASKAKKTARKKTATVVKPAGKKPAAKKKTPSKKSGIKAAVVARKTRTKRKAGTTDRLQEIRKALLAKREGIVREAKEEIAKYISGENRQLVDTALDEGDWAVVDISEDVNFMRLATHRKSLHDIDEALRKISEGSYGICEECGEEIGAKRLSIIPTATLCVNCQGNKEQLEAIEKAEPSV